ncbi:hypothetical protein [Mesorhizobium sp. M7D.F.Ca.US.004.01.2.1]|nr:hypothetical protein [Mesorhizobium sp. M7D.F.Ca.US.004.01.2.1]
MMLDLLGGFGEKGRTSLAVSSGNDRILLHVGLGNTALRVVIQITNLSAAKLRQSSAYA